MLTPINHISIKKIIIQKMAHTQKIGPMATGMVLKKKKLSKRNLTNPQKMMHIY